MSCANNTPVTADPIRAEFVEVVAHNVKVDGVKSDVILAVCAQCSTANEVAVPKQFFHVVSYGSSIGIFTSQAIADSFVLGIPKASRVVYHSKAEAKAALRTALNADTADLI